jgi:hypothetical protein
MLVSVDYLKQRHLSLRLLRLHRHARPQHLLRPALGLATHLHINLRLPSLQIPKSTQKRIKHGLQVLSWVLWLELRSLRC